MAGKPCKTIHPELQKKAIIEEIWLKYYNQVLFEKGIRGQVDFWGYDVNHDWNWWFRQVDYYVPQFLF